jgi:futalosine hydrolase
MRILAAAATALEVAPLISRFDGQPPSVRLSPPLSPVPEWPRIARYAHAGRVVDLLITGVGMVATAAWCVRALSASHYDAALNLGLCGSFDPALAPGRVVHVIADRIAELGAEDGEQFLTLEELNLIDPGGEPFTRAELTNDHPPASAALAALPCARAITVSTVHGDEASITAVTARWRPQVESMEGAGFMYACLIHGVRFAQIRAVSNMVERRNRTQWRIPDALENLAGAACAVIETL